MKKVVITGDHWLDEPSARSYQRARAAGLPAGITDAARDEAEQRRLYNLWKAGKMPGTPTVALPGTSLHEKGNALDLPEPARSWMHKHGEEYGWVNPPWAKLPAFYEPWHFEYDPLKDQHRTLGAIGGFDKDAKIKLQQQLGGLKVDGDFAGKSVRRLREVLNAKDGNGGFKLVGGPLKGGDTLTTRDIKAIEKLINIWHRRTKGKGKSFRLAKGPLKATGKLTGRTAIALRKTLNKGYWK